ncbi:hypothetical protein CYMTET_21867 [Cymbomonas tetramitiformis]|uniref:Uncharacterized protein n=1 Tax=Cymbomonas tetramitiformis TaxID=36881 RepID=A0AAE0G169_9CHLO|nr:hypothetical protein CYMTET_21867 [Cymbomonas tetramitiformis]
MYEQLVLGPALAYFYDALQFSDDTLELLENQDKVAVSARKIEQRVYEAHNTFMGVFILMAQRYSMLQLRASLDSLASAHGGPEALKAKLAFMEEKVYNNSDGVTNESIFNQWLQKVEPTLQERVRRRKGAWRAAGANAEVLQWISRAAKINLTQGPPAPFDDDVSLRDITATQQTWLEKEAKRHVDNGA